MRCRAHIANAEIFEGQVGVRGENYSVMVSIPTHSTQSWVLTGPISLLFAFVTSSAARRDCG